MNETVNWFAGLVDHMNLFLATPGPLRAVLFGLLLSWSGTQALKFLPTLRCLGRIDHRVMTRLLAFGLAYIPVALLWPGALPEKLLAAVTTGLCSPAAYTIVVRITYHFAPWLEPRLSAKPKDCGSE